MKRLTVICLAALVQLAVSVPAHAAVRYVDVNCANPTPPYTNWATAATVIQYALNAAVAGDEILVTNGVYAAGGGNDARVSLVTPVSVRSVNGRPKNSQPRSILAQGL